MDKSERIKDLVELLNKANKAYYQEANEIMTNFEYDKLYDELVGLEKETGMVLSNSPTVNVGYQVVSQLPKEQHNSPMLWIRRRAWRSFVTGLEIRLEFCLGKWTA